MKVSVKKKPLSHVAYSSGNKWVVMSKTGEVAIPLSSSELVSLLEESPATPVKFYLSVSGGCYKLLSLKGTSTLKKLGVLWNLIRQCLRGDVSFAWRRLGRNRIQTFESERNLSQLPQLKNPLSFCCDWTAEVCRFVQKSLTQAFEWTFVFAPAPDEDLYLIVMCHGAVLLSRKLGEASLSDTQLRNELAQTKQYLKRFKYKEGDKASVIAFKKITTIDAKIMTYLSLKELHAHLESIQRPALELFPKPFRMNHLSYWLPKLSVAISIPVCLVFLGLGGANFWSGWSLKTQHAVLQEKIKAVPANLANTSQELLERKKYFVLYSELVNQNPNARKICSRLMHCFPEKVRPHQLAWRSAPRETMLTLAMPQMSNAQQKNINERLRQYLNAPILAWKKGENSPVQTLEIRLQAREK